MDLVPIGHHIYSSTDSDILNEAIKNNATFVQLFLTSPKSGNAPRKSIETLKKINKSAKKANIKIVVHASFLLNFCNDPNSFVHKNAVRLLTHDLNDSVYLDAIGVVVHMGKSNTKEKKYTDEEALENYVIGIKECLKNSNKESILIFETGAGQGSEICTSFYGLSKLYNCFTKEEQKRIKFCIDTCHIYTSGHDIKDEKFMEMFEELVESTITWNKVCCIHLNDSKSCLGKCVDSHADIGKGYIGDDGLKYFVKLCNKKKIPMVLETPEDYYDDNDNVVKEFATCTKTKYSFGEQLDKIRCWIND